MGFDLNSLIPLALQIRQQRENRQFAQQENRRDRQRDQQNELMQFGIDLIGKGGSAKDIIPMLRERGLSQASEGMLVTAEKARRQGEQRDQRQQNIASREQETADLVQAAQTNPERFGDQAAAALQALVNLQGGPQGAADSGSLARIAIQGPGAAFARSETGPFERLVDPRTGQGVTRRRDDPELTALARGGMQAIPAQMTGTPGEFGLPLGPSGLREAAQQGVQAAGTIAEASTVLGQLAEVGPSATGVRGLVNERVIGPLAQALPGIDAEIAGITGGATLDEIQEFRTRAQAFAAQSLPILLNEVGRYTDPERQIANRASALISPSASFEQTAAGVRAIMELAVLVSDRSEMQLGGEPSNDLRTPAGRAVEFERLLRLGLSEVQASRVVGTMLTQRNEIRRMMRGRGRPDSGTNQ